MTVQRIAKKKADTVSIDQFIEKGGKPPCEINEKDKEVKITLRLPKSLVEMIDGIRSEGFSRHSRNSWIIEAISYYIDPNIGS